jgi:general stress protein 26
MVTDAPGAQDILGKAKVARIATLSRNGRPAVNPLWFVQVEGRIWLGTADWTLAARNVRADPRVCLPFEVESAPRDRRVLRVCGRASLRTESSVQRAFIRRVARKYFLTTGGLRNTLAHWRQLPLMRRYYAQSAAKGKACVIEVVPKTAVILTL